MVVAEESVEVVLELEPEDEPTESDKALMQPQINVLSSVPVLLSPS